MTALIDLWYLKRDKVEEFLKFIESYFEVDKNDKEYFKRKRKLMEVKE